MAGGTITREWPATEALGRGAASLDWARIGADLDERGFATIGPLLSAADCAELARSYEDRKLFRSRIDMARHRFGRGEYQYFANPLPGPSPRCGGPLRAAGAGRQPLARGDAARRRFPPTLDELTARCHAAGQTRPTPLLLRYGPGTTTACTRTCTVTSCFRCRWRSCSAGPATISPAASSCSSSSATRPVARRGRAAAPGRGRDFRRPPSPGSGNPGHLPGCHAARRKHACEGTRFTLGIIFHDAT